MELRYSRKSMLGSRRSHIGTFNEATSKKFEILPKNLQIAETLRKQDSASNSKISSAMKNLTVRQPRKSMLGTRKLNRDSIVPPFAPDSSLSSQNQDSVAVESDPSADNTLPSSQLRMSIVHDDVSRIPSLEGNFFQRTLPSDIFGKLSKATTLTEERESPPLHRNVPIREMFPSCTTSCIDSETLLADDESLLATTLNDTTVTNEDSFLAANEKPESPLPRRDISIRLMSPSCILDSKDNSFIKNETLLADEESLLAKSFVNELASTSAGIENEETLLIAPVVNENSCCESTLKDESKEDDILTTSVTNKKSFLASQLIDDMDEVLSTSFTDENRFVTSPPEVRLKQENVLTIGSSVPAVMNKSSSLSTSLRDITNTHTDIPTNNATLIKDTATVHKQSKEHDDEMLFRMLDLINTWISRSTESVEIYEKEIAVLQKKKDQTNEEIEDMKNLKQTLIEKFAVKNEEKENVDVEPIPTTVEDKMFKSPVVSPSKTYLKEMRSTIKFMKTPLTARNRMPRHSVMLTPHSMSFCLQNQFEQLLE